MDYIDKLKISEDGKNIIRNYDILVKKNLNRNLYLHSVNTLKYASMLSEKHNVDLKDHLRICIASILHDYGKSLDIDKQRKIVIKNIKEVKIKSGDMEIDALFHGFSGSFILREELSISDKKIIEAVRYHTTGKLNMNMVDKIVYISDKIEDDRQYEDIDYLREISLKNINLCLLEVYKNNIIYIIKRNKRFYSQTFNIWNNICRLYGGFLNGPGR
ncbi:MAG: bis(5'-nucleosyl)-tetraphosphatase (symmetrical) YqeK [Actinomycetota bacterium]|nr:bis(5'-nucleosyl)-tetraphosphatase (symmetrical) YqeK [Actinomycetota bacterium]